MILTFPAAASILDLPLKKTGVGIETPENKGEKSPVIRLLKPVFFCPPKIETVLIIRLASYFMVERFRQPQGWPVPLSGSLNLIRSATPRLRPTGGGISSNKGDRHV